MIFTKAEKRKKHKGFAIAIGALAMYGAYSVIKCTKDFCCSRASAMAGWVDRMKMKKSKAKSQVCTTTDSTCCADSEEEPYD